jgi:hypothetical protein
MEKEGRVEGREGRGMSMPRQFILCCGATGSVGDEEKMTQGPSENCGYRQIIGLRRGGVAN